MLKFNLKFNCMRIIIFPAAVAAAIQFCQKLNNIQMTTERLAQLGDVIASHSYHVGILDVEMLTAWKSEKVLVNIIITIIMIIIIIIIYIIIIMIIMIMSVPWLKVAALVKGWHPPTPFSRRLTLSHRHHYHQHPHHHHHQHKGHLSHHLKPPFYF